MFCFSITYFLYVAGVKMSENLEPSLDASASDVLVITRAIGYPEENILVAVPMNKGEALTKLLTDYFLGRDGFKKKYNIDFDVTARWKPKEYFNSNGALLWNTGNRPWFFYMGDVNKKEIQGFELFFSDIMANYLLTKDASLRGGFPVEYDAGSIFNQVRIQFQYPLFPDFRAAIFTVLDEQNKALYDRFMDADVASMYIGIGIHPSRNTQKDFPDFLNRLKKL